MTDIQFVFCAEYLLDFDPGAACRRAHNNTITRKQSDKIAKQWIKRPDIQSVIRNNVSDRVEKTVVTADSVIAEHNQIIALALEKSDLATATSNVIAKGRSIGLYSDTLNTNDVQQAQALAQASESETIELRRIAGIRLGEMREANNG